MMPRSTGSGDGIDTLSRNIPILTTRTTCTMKKKPVTEAEVGLCSGKRRKTRITSKNTNVHWVSTTMTETGSITSTIPISTVPVNAAGLIRLGNYSRFSGGEGVTSPLPPRVDKNLPSCFLRRFD